MTALLPTERRELSRSASRIRAGPYLKYSRELASVATSALGQKQTCAVQEPMSALPPIATSIAVFGMSALAKSGHKPWPRHFTRTGTSLFRMRRPQVWKLLEDVGVRLEARGGTLIFRQEGQAVIDHIVSEDPAVRIFCWFRWIKT